MKARRRENISDHCLVLCENLIVFFFLKRRQQKKKEQCKKQLY